MGVSRIYRMSQKRYEIESKRNFGISQTHSNPFLTHSLCEKDYSTVIYDQQSADHTVSSKENNFENRISHCSRSYQGDHDGITCFVKSTFNFSTVRSSSHENCQVGKLTSNITKLLSWHNILHLEFHKNFANLINLLMNCNQATRWSAIPCLVSQNITLV